VYNLVSCPKCGKDNPENSESCQECGSSLKNTQNPSSENKGGLTDYWKNQSSRSKFYVILGTLVLVGLLIASAAAVIYDNIAMQNNPVSTSYGNVTNNSSNTSPELLFFLIPLVHTSTPFCSKSNYLMMYSSVGYL
jgi:uncharacterized membrane protein YvbJ